MKTTSIIYLDIARSTSPISIFAKQGDNNARKVEIHLLENGVSYTIPEGAKVIFSCRKPDGKQVYNDENAVIDTGKNAIVVSLTDQELAAAGIAQCDVTLMKDEDILSTQNFFIIIQATALNGAKVESSDDYLAFKNALTRVPVAIVAFSQHPDGTDFSYTWQEGMNYVGYTVGTTMPDTKEKFQWVRAADMVNVSQELGESETDAVSQKTVTREFKKIITESVNLFNPNSDLILANNLIAGVSLVEMNGFTVSHPIPVLKGVEYRWIQDKNNGANADVGICTEDGSIISVGHAIIQEGYCHYTPTENCFIRVNLGAYDVNAFMVCRADKYPDAYVSFGILLNEDIKINDSASSNPLKGKKLAVNGDSICAGEGFGGGYAGLIGNKNGMIVQNIGVSGATIAEGTTLSNGANRHWICSTIGNIDADADFVILEGGVNDAALNVPIGSISSRYSTDFDSTTFCGAFEHMLKMLTSRFAGKKIGYIAVHKIATGFLSHKICPPSSGLTDEDYTKYYDAAKAACAKWGVPFLDLNVAVPPLGFFTSSSFVSDDLKAVTERYTKDGDGWHPNKDGYLKYYVPKIEAWLKTL